MTQEKAPVEFLDLSVTLTGYKTVDLQGTGLVDFYWTQLGDLAGDDIRSRLMAAWDRARGSVRGNGVRLDRAVRREIMSDAVLGPVGRNLVKLWYLGQWDALPTSWWAEHGPADPQSNQDQIPSPAAYREGLVWDAIGAHPQGAKQEGFGTWQFPPGRRSR